MTRNLNDDNRLDLKCTWNGFTYKTNPFPHDLVLRNNSKKTVQVTNTKQLIPLHRVASHQNVSCMLLHCWSASGLFRNNDDPTHLPRNIGHKIENFWLNGQCNFDMQKILPSYFTTWTTIAKKNYKSILVRIYMKIENVA